MRSGHGVATTMTARNRRGSPVIVHAATATPGNPCGTLVGSGPDQVPSAGNGRDLPWGLRTVDGTCNNLAPGQDGFGAADRPFLAHEQERRRRRKQQAGRRGAQRLRLGNGAQALAQRPVE